MLKFRDLAGESGQTLYDTFMEAFSDYSVPIAWSREDFESANIRRGYDPSLSIGAYEEGRLIGFILSGSGLWQGRPAAYDMGTGVIPAKRGGGLAGRLAEELKRVLAERGVGIYVLEVIRDNEPAIKTYTRAGFAVTRTLECPGGDFSLPARKRRARPAAEVGAGSPSGAAASALTGAADALLAAEAGAAGIAGAAETAQARGGWRGGLSFGIEELASFPKAEMAGFRDWEPSWQNSDASIARSPEPPLVLGALAGGRLIGCLVAGRNGVIWQLAVERAERRKGVGTALLAALVERSGPKLRYINIQSDDAATLGLLASTGISEGVGQYEMILRL